jgi:hypothetical protein
LPEENNLLKLTAHFAGRQSVQRYEVVAFLQELEPDLTDQTIAWRIHQLKDKGLITYVSRGVYSFVVRDVWEPELTRWSKRLLNLVREANPTIELCIWHSSFLNDLADCPDCHQYTFVEVERGAMESTFDALTALSKKVYLNPDATFVARYILPLPESIVVRPLVSEAPLIEVKGTPTSSLEKVMVDLMVDESFLKPVLDAKKVSSTLQKLVNTFQVSQSKMLRYVGRRNQRARVQARLAALDLLIA